MNEREVKVGDKIKVRLRFEHRVVTVTVTKLFPEFRNSNREHNPWWIEGWTKSGKTGLRFALSEIVEYL